MNEIAVVPERGTLTAADVSAQVNLIQEVMRAVMKKDVHYGVVPGCGEKQTLLKAGAEKILSTFRIAVDPVVEDLSCPDVVRFRVITKGIHQISGQFLGSGVGEASSDEEKYKWRSAVCEAEFEVTPDDRRRLKYKRDGTTIKQIRTNPADTANTILKMAKKRSQIDMTLTVTAASDVFAQDIEDLPEEVRDHIAGEATSLSAIVEPRAKTKPEGMSITFTPVKVSSFAGTNKHGKPYIKYGIVAPNDVSYGTFDKAHAELAQKAVLAKEEITVHFVQDGRYFNATEITHAKASEFNVPA